MVDGGKASHGWTDTEAEGQAAVAEALHQPCRGTNAGGARTMYFRLE